MPRSAENSENNSPVSERRPRSPVQMGGVIDQRTDASKNFSILPPPSPPSGPLQMGGTIDQRTDLEVQVHRFDREGKSRSSTSSKAKIVPGNRNSFNSKNTNNNNRRNSSTSNTSFHCQGKFGAVGNCIVGTLAFLFILVLLILAILFSDGSSKSDDSAESSTPKWDGVYNGTYLAQAGSGRFSSKSGSTSRTSLPFRWAQSEHRIRIDKKTDPYDGRTYYEIKSRDSTASDYKLTFRFHNGQPFKVDLIRDDYPLTGTATISVKGNIWRETLPNRPKLEIEREFQPNGVMSVVYKSGDVVYYKKFEKKNAK